MFFATITGTVGRDPEAKTGQYEGVQFNVAVKHGWTKSQGSLTQWITIDAIGQKGQFVLDNVCKGDLVTCLIEVRRIAAGQGAVRPQIYARLIELEGGAKRQPPGVTEAAHDDDLDEMPF
jgi:single-stranded DNA-binding protein